MNWLKGFFKSLEKTKINYFTDFEGNLFPSFGIYETKKGTFEYWKSKKDFNYYFHLKASNGKIIAQSEGYKTKISCLKGIESVKRFAKNSETKELKI